MEENLKTKTGKSLEEWITIVKKQNFAKHGEILKYLKTEHEFTHGFANFVALKSRKADSGSFSEDELIVNQYKNKENLKLIYSAIIKKVKELGDDIEIAPKKANVSLRRKKQFALIQPSTKTRIDLGLKIKDKETGGRLENSGPFGSMCTHRVKIENLKDFNNEVLGWLKEAYEGAN